MRGTQVEKLVNTLFGAFWNEVESFDVDSVSPALGAQQWEVPVSWTRVAQSDGTSKALVLLEFRVNRLSRLLTVSDCWPRKIGLHLAHWLDTHMHLVLSAERRQSGPQHGASTDAALLSLFDWRYDPPSHALGVHEMLFREETPMTVVGKLYAKLIANMSLCKTLDKALVSVGKTNDGKRLVCAAFVRCLIGLGPHKADTSLRKSVHAALGEGLDALFNRIIDLSSRHHFPIVFIAMREFIVRSVRDDISLGRYLDRTPKWGAFVANTLNTAETMRVFMRDQVKDGDLFEHKLASANVEKVAFVRHCKKVPGVFSRAGRKTMKLNEVCRTLKRFRDRHAERDVFRDDFTNIHDVAVHGMVYMHDLCPETPVPVERVFGLLRQAGGEVSRIFVQLVRASTEGVEGVLKLANNYKTTQQEAHAHRNALSDDFLKMCDCLDIIDRCGASFSVDVPKTYADKQRAAVRRRFENVSEEEGFLRASQMLWCNGCKTVKNFVLTDAADVKPLSAHGYKRCSQGDLGVMCHEKRRTVCCEKVPVRRISLLTHERSFCFSLFEKMYAITTCCGHLALLKCLSSTQEEPLCCARCATMKLPSPKKVPARRCHYCDCEVSKVKGCFTGEFLDKEGTSMSLTFCTRHTRGFMRKDREPLLLEESLHEIAKKIKH